MVTNLYHKKPIVRATEMNMLITFVKGKGVCPQGSITTYYNSLQTSFFFFLVNVTLINNSKGKNVIN